MTTLGFRALTPKRQMDHLKKSSTLIHKIITGNLTISLYWSKDFIYEVLNPKNKLNECEIKCFDRFKYVQF